MKYFLPGFFVMLIFISSGEHVFGKGPGPQNTLILENQVFGHGETVSITIDFLNEIEEGDILFFRVFDGNLGEKIISKTQPLLDAKTQVEFVIPENTKSDKLIIYPEVNSIENKPKFIHPQIIYTDENAAKKAITDLKIDKNQIVPGESIHIQFQVKDGNGKNIPNTRIQVSLCDDVPEVINNRPYTPSIQDRLDRDHPGQYGYCIINYPDIFSSTEKFDISLHVHDTVPQGIYKLVIFADSSDNYEEFLIREWTEINVVGQPIESKSPDVFVAVEIEEPEYSEIPRRHLSPDQAIVFSPRQTTEGEYHLQSDTQIATSGIFVNLFVVNPQGNNIFEKTIGVDSEGNFEQITFPITNELKQGTYTVYYNATKDGDFLLNYDRGGATDFTITNEQEFNINADDKDYFIYLQSLDLVASNPVFDQEAKTLTIDIEKIKGDYYDKHNFHKSIHAGEAILTLEKPLMSGPFQAHLDGELIFIEWWPTLRNDKLNIEEISLKGVDESGKLVITATHVVPEFGTISVLILAGSILPIILLSKFRVIFSKN